MRKMGNLIKKVAEAYFRACAGSDAWMCTGSTYPIYRVQD